MLCPSGLPCSQRCCARNAGCFVGGARIRRQPHGGRVLLLRLLLLQLQRLLQLLPLLLMQTPSLLPYLRWKLSW